MTMAAVSQDPSVASYYVDDAFYGALVARFTGWQDEARLIGDYPERDLFRALLEREARVLDQHDYDSWLAMLTRACVYWAPGTPQAGDPRTEIAVMFDDRRRLEDRIYRLRTGYAWSQAPVSRTVRLITNVEVFEAEDADHRMLRSNFLISEFWDNQVRVLTGWCGHHMEKTDGRWLIRAKQINLIDCDQCIRNPSIIL
ncbi:MAG: aromatic-ring-hydroxylating dioxygenase beta subunit [Hyphomicrobiales bacterium]|nr:aromatic-ring-hydroxylating dioxygenase beta subunit [Hyphomicrobiales bacterium]